jgi:hypothetical protein
MRARVLTNSSARQMTSALPEHSSAAHAQPQPDQMQVDFLKAADHQVRDSLHLPLRNTLMEGHFRFT